MSERRRFPRLDTSLTVNYSLIPATITTSVSEYSKTGIINNLSVGGLNITTSFVSKFVKRKITNHKLKFNIEFHIPQKQHKVRAIGFSIWMERINSWWNLFESRHKIGIQFSEIDKDSRSAIAEYIITKSVEQHLKNRNV